MIQEELRNFIEQNCSGKEPSDLIMDAIGQKIEQLGADADEVLAFVEECAKGPTLDQKVEAAKQNAELAAFFMRSLTKYKENMGYLWGQINSHTRVEVTPEEFKLHSRYYFNSKKLENNNISTFLELNNIKTHANSLFKEDKNLSSLLKGIHEQEAAVLYEGAMSEINSINISHITIKNLKLVLNSLRYNYSDITTISIPDLEAKIKQVNQKYLDQEKENKQNKEDNTGNDGKSEVFRQDKEPDVSFFDKLKMIFKILFDKV